jgi:uncharacterized membrane protein
LLFVTRFFLVLHILGAIIAVGFSVSYGIWTALGDATGAAERAFALRSISWIDRRMTTPAFILQFFTGTILVWLIGTALLQQTWLRVSIGLYILLTVLAIAKFAPLHRRQLALAEQIAAGETPDEDYTAVASRARIWGIAVVLITLTIVVLMVTKPGV